jgi:UDP-N-acetylglucosamine 2-epimerase (non-hydrolysing)
MRPNTERPITISHGTNRLVEPSEVVEAGRAILAGPRRPTGPRPPLWDGHAGERIADEIVSWLEGRGSAAAVGAAVQSDALPQELRT